ncbi:PREDICTED: E3 ubiquitin-protein ligase TRIM36-like isoform X1 [Branchiostoma belcheri]|uniref:E3 ubiquitin-protein ligase TRIM36-like isoform X1 n=1 Tax=Branchiostoma belcheri TaxID=7741 RepID=A0A6P4YMF5_BRABE|nr:PREDICTED: E3 ubiquitin-protein ligase TRIM36-like isoform X1 [Branchiostoma belcheri]
MYNSTSTDGSDFEDDLAEFVRLFPAISLCTCHNHGNRQDVVCEDLATESVFGASPELSPSEEKVRRTLSRRTSRSGNEPVTPGTPSSKHSRIPMPSFKSPPEESSSPESTSDVSPSPVSSSGTSDSRSRKASSSSDLSSFANMERELRCPVCSEFFTQPLVLPCQHNICHRCAKEILYRDSPETLPGGPLYSAVQSPLKSPLPAKVRRGSTPGPLQRAASFRRKNSSSRLSTPTGPKSPPPLKEFPCPKCQEGVELGPKGINGLYRNFILETIVERYKFQARKAGAIACQSCKPRPPADATKTCLDCQASFCNECFKTVHIWGTPKAQHEYVGPTSSFRPRALLCVEHETEKVSMYCQACKRPVCHLCKLGGSHANHKFHHMNTAYKNIEEKLRSSLQILKDKQEKVEEQKRVVMEKRENSKKAASLVKDNIMKAFDSLHAILDDRKSVLLEKAEKVMSAQESELDAALAQTREMMGVSGLIEYVEQVLKENNHACFLQTATGLCKRVKEATEMKLPTDLDVTCESLTLDVRREEELLSQLDFLQAPNKVDLCKDGIVAEDGQADVTWNPLPANSPPVDSLHVQYWKMAAVGLADLHDGTSEVPTHAQTIRCDDVISGRCELSGLESGAWYAFRVRACNGAGPGPWSDIGTVRTSPDLRFDLEDNYDHDALRADIKGRAVTSVLQPAKLRPDNAVNYVVTMETHYVTGDVKIAGGHHYWEVGVAGNSFLVCVGVADEGAIQTELRRQSDADSGHDSCDENDTVGVTNAMATVTVTMGTLEGVDKSVTRCHGDGGSRVGIFVDADEGIVRFYDVTSKKMVKECCVDAGKVFVPLIGLCGPGTVHY